MIESLLEEAGIKVNGGNPWDITVHNQNTFARVLKEGTLGLGESYVEGWWDCPRLDIFVDKVYRSNIEVKVKQNLRMLLRLWMHRVFNFQKPRRAFEIGKKHYDIGNDLFSAMLDKRMTYTCGYWKNADSLDDAQEAKLDLVCRKMGLQPGMKILDIGCGWGALLRYAAEKYGISGVGITVSKEQAELARQNCQQLPIEIRLMDYRDLNSTNEQFDHVVSLGMFEHVGYKNYRQFMQTVRHCLADEGLFLLHTIGSNTTLYAADEWISKYIFPNGMIPSIKQVGGAIEGLFVMEDWHNFGTDYDKTLMAWDHNFEQHWGELKQHYDATFYRLWHYYLLTCAGAFRARSNELWQIVLSKNGVYGGYQSIR